MAADRGPAYHLVYLNHRVGPNGEQPCSSLRPPEVGIDDRGYHILHNVCMCFQNVEFVCRPAVHHQHTVACKDDQPLPRLRQPDKCIGVLRSLLY